MASTPRTPARPDRRGPTPGASKPASAQPVPSAPPPVLEIELSHPIKAGMPTELTTRLVFTRPPGLGELDGWLDESDPIKMAVSLEVLPFRPAWQIHVISQCTLVSLSEAKRIASSDLLRIGQALAPFLEGSLPTGERAPSGSPAASAGGLETSPD